MSLGVIYKKVVGLEQRTSELEGQVKILMSMNKKINQNIDNDVCDPIDEVWGCEKCSFKLGCIDKAEGMVRVSHGNLHGYWEPSPGSAFAIICFKCSFINKLEYNLPNSKIDDNIITDNGES